MKKKTVKKSTMFNMKGILILVAFGIWVNLMVEISDNFDTIEEALSTYAGNTLFVVIAAYIVLVILGLFIEGESAE